jgi:hypothetical protein
VDDAVELLELLLPQPTASADVAIAADATAVSRAPGALRNIASSFVAVFDRIWSRY